MEVAPLGRVTARRPAVRLDGGKRSERPDTLVVEEPLELRVAGRATTVTMRTPGDDVDLASGFLATAGVAGHTEDIAEMRYCAGVDENGVNTYNVLDVALSASARVPQPQEPVDRDPSPAGSCAPPAQPGIGATRTGEPYEVATDPVTFPPDTLAGLPDRTRSARRVLAGSDGLHAAGVFTPAGDLVCLREDIDAHNAVDKAVGWALRDARVPLRGHVLVLSARASFELTRKALLAGVPALTADSAPSSPAVDLADEHGMTLVHVSGSACLDVYTGAHRVGHDE